MANAFIEQEITSNFYRKEILNICYYSNFFFTKLLTFVTTCKHAEIRDFEMFLYIKESKKRELIMGISHINNKNAVNLLKLNLNSRAQKAEANKPEYLKMTGSIFNAPNANAKPQVNSLNNLNTEKSLQELNKKPTNGAVLENPTSSNGTTQSGDASSVKSMGEKAEKLTADAEKEGKVVTKFNTDAIKLNKDLIKSDKKFKQTLNKQEAELKRDNEKLQKLIQNTEETQTEIDNAQKELDSLLGSSSFSINQNGQAQGSGNNNSARIKELQQIIGTKTTLVQSNGKNIYSLQRSSSRTIARMNATNARYIKTNKAHQKAIHNNQSETSNVVKFATTVEQISALTEQGGKTLDLTGQGLVLAGQALLGTPAGSAMIATGTFFSKVGVVVEMAGQYGQAAANITKTAAYVSEGNLVGAMTSATAAVQTGTAAVKSTKDMKKTFEAINDRATEATQKGTADALAKDAVKGMDQKKADELGLGGLSKKEMKKAISGQLQEKMAKGELDAKTVLSELKKNNLNEKTFGAIKDAAGEAKKAFSDNITAAGGTLKDGVVSGLTKKETKKARQKTVSGFTNTVSKDAEKSSRKFDFGNFSDGILSTAAMFSSQNSNTSGTNSTGYAQQWDLTQDRKFMKIRKSHMARSARA